jgi:ADP-dependent NAD(P)H-hydrate dehydratase / NAD(P)H-hydrate epimerase
VRTVPDLKEDVVLQALTAAQSRTAEERAVARGTSLAELMERAGSAVAAEAAEFAPEGHVAVVAGKGNNGGDGWVAARLLHEAGRDVSVLAFAAPDVLARPAGDAARAALAAGVDWTLVGSDEALLLGLADASLVVDALLGTGASGAPREPYARAIEAVAESDALVLSVDVPSGLDSDTGAASGAAVAADVTVTFSALKRGLVVGRGATLAGDVVLADIGIADEDLAFEGVLETWSWDEYRDLLPLPAFDANKGSRGRVLIVGGAPGMTGAVCLAASGAQRMGAGYVTVAVPSPSLHVVEIKLTAPVKAALDWDEVTGLTPAAVRRVLELAAAVDAVVLGPGLGRLPGTIEAVLQLAEGLACPLVLDADGLYALGGSPQRVASRAAATVLTPHSGEAARLLCMESGAAVDADRPAAAVALACAVGPRAVAVLKGPRTLVAGGGRLVANMTGGPALATLGTGDVLAGMCGALLAQGLGPVDAGALASHIHGAAGDLAAGALTPVCSTAEDVLTYVPGAVGALLGADGLDC